MRTLITTIALLPLLALTACGPSEGSAAETTGDQDDASTSLDGGEPVPALPSSTPEQALRSFLEQLEAADIEGAARLVIVPSEERRRAALERSLKQTATLLSSGRLDYRWMEVKAQGNWAVAVTKLTMTSGATTEVRVRDEFILRERGGWRLAPEAVRGDPVVRERIDDDFRVLFSWYRENQARLAETHAAE